MKRLINYIIIISILLILMGCKEENVQQINNSTQTETETTVNVETTPDPYMDFVAIEDVLENQSSKNEAQETTQTEEITTVPTVEMEDSEDIDTTQISSNIENMGDLIP